MYKFLNNPFFSHNSYHNIYLLKLKVQPYFQRVAAKTLEQNMVFDI